MTKRKIYPKSERFPIGKVQKVSKDFYPRNQEKPVCNKSNSVNVPRSGLNYFRGDCLSWPTKKERTQLMKKYDDWDARYGKHAMSFREVDQWSKFIEAKPWQFFATFTTRHTMTAKSARRAIMKWCEVVSNELHIDNPQKPFECFWVIEPHAQYGKEGVHIHALVSLPEYWRTRHMERLAHQVLIHLWQRVTGGRKIGSGIVDGTWNRVDIQSYRGVSACRYTIKYLTKDLVDWDYFTTFNNEIDEGIFAKSID